MKLEVRNFKGLEKIDVELKPGLSLIKGPSGTGKSTLIESLLYTFTGKPSRCKPLGTNKKTEVRVTFTYKSQKIEIVRTTRPGRLLVNVDETMKIEDAEAQSFINSIIGEQFDIISYIPQNTTKSFMCMSPANKREFLDHIALDGQAGNWQEAAKKNVKESKLAFAKAESALEVHKNMWAEAKFSFIEGEFDETKYPSDDEKLKECKEKFELNKRDAKDQLRLIRHEMKECEAELSQFKVQEALKTEKEKRVKNKKLRKQKLDEQLEESPCDNIADLKEMERETKDIVKEICRIETLEASYPRWYRQHGQTKNMEKVNADWFEEQKMKKEKLKKSIEAAKLKNSVFFDCPACDTNLCFDKVTEEAAIWNSSTPQFCRKSVKELMREDAQIDSKIKERKVAIQEIEKTKLQIQNIKDEWEEEMEKEELEESLYAIRDFIDIMKRKRKLVSDIDSLENEKEGRRQAGHSVGQRQAEEIEKNIETLRFDREKEEQKCEEANETIQDIYEWKNKRDNHHRLNSIELSVEKAKKTMNEKLEEFKGAEELKTAVEEAYSLSLLTILNQINDTADVYLDEFFKEDPIEVRLTAFSSTKTNKKVKPSVKCEILYKSNEMTLENLSGGERARVVIAFNLALCDILSSSFVMLDEVTANLDADLTEQIFETVKNSMGDKIIVAVAHQCVDGVFDKVINF